MAGTEAAGVGELEARVPQVAGGELVGEGLPGGGAALVLAGTARMAGGTALDADENVFLGFGHGILLVDGESIAKVMPEISALFSVNWPVVVVSGLRQSRLV